MSDVLVKETACVGQEFLDLCARAERGEILIYAISVGSHNAEWLVEWAERREAPKKAQQQELFGS